MLQFILAWKVKGGGGSNGPPFDFLSFKFLLWYNCSLFVNTIFSRYLGDVRIDGAIMKRRAVCVLTTKFQIFAKTV